MHRSNAGIRALAHRVASACEGTGERETLCLLAEAVADLLPATECFTSVIDADGMRLIDLAGFSRDGRFGVVANEYSLAGYPATCQVAFGGTPQVWCVDDPDCEPAEADYMRAFGLTAELMLTFQAGPRHLLMEAWRDAPGDRFDARDMDAASALVARCVPLVEEAIARDADEELRFGAAVGQAEELGAADRTLPGLALAVGEVLRLDEGQLRELRLVALVHDISRRPIPEPMLAKPEPLTAVEWAVVRAGTRVGQRMLARMPYLTGAVEGAGAVRERWDGDGYPRGLAGEDIPLAARVVSACAAYRAMLEGRPRRAPLSHEAALDELRSQAGRQFDPDVVRAACAVLRPDGPVPVVRLRLATI